MEDIKGFDTNILVYAFDLNEKEKHEKAMKILESVRRGEFKGFLSVQNLNELFYVITNKGIKNLAEAELIIRSILGSDRWIVKAIGAETTMLAISITKKGGHFWDSLILANLILNGIKEIYTEDITGFRSEFVKAINPLG